MRCFVVFLIMFFCSQKSISQTFEELGVRFFVKDSLITIENVDKGLKKIKILEKDSTFPGAIELIINYQIKGDVVENHKLYTKRGVVEIEIVYKGINKKMILKR